MVVGVKLRQRPEPQGRVVVGRVQILPVFPQVKQELLIQVVVVAAAKVQFLEQPLAWAVQA